MVYVRINRQPSSPLSASASCSLGLAVCGGNNDKKQESSDSAKRNSFISLRTSSLEVDQQCDDLAVAY